MSGPGRIDLRTGEPTLIVVLACYVALAASAKHFGRAGTGLALALTKPTFGIPLAILLACRRRIRAAMIGIGAAVAISLAASIELAHAAGGVGRLVDSLRSDLDVTGRSLQSRIGTPLRLDAANALARATGLRPSENAASAFGLVLLALGAWATWRLHTRDPDGDRAELAVTLAALVILVPIFRVDYDLLLLTWPLLLLARRRPNDEIGPRGLRTVLTLLLLIPMVDPMGWSVVGDVLGRDGVVSELLGPTAMGLCLLAAFVTCCLLALLPVRARSAVPS